MYVWAPPPPRASHWRDDVIHPRRLLGWRIRDDGDDDSVQERDAVKLASALIWLMFICSRFICCFTIAQASDEPLAFNFSRARTVVSPPVVCVFWQRPPLWVPPSISQQQKQAKASESAYWEIVCVTARDGNFKVLRDYYTATNRQIAETETSCLRCKLVLLTSEELACYHCFADVLSWLTIDGG